MRTVRTLLRVLALLLAGLIAIRLGGGERGTALITVLAALPVLLLPAWLLLLLSAPLRDRVLAGLAALAVAGHLLVLAPALTAAPIGAEARTAPRLRVVTANLYVLNPDPERAGRALRALAADVLVVPELTREGEAGLRASGLLADLPYAVVEEGSGAEIVGLFSRLPLVGVERTRFAGRVLPRAVVDVGGVDVQVFAEHVQPAVSVLEAQWRGSLERLAGAVHATRLPVVVVGDLNATGDHRPFRRLLGTGLRDAHAERGRALARSFPSSAPLVLYDHVLVRDGAGGRLEVLAVREAEVPGSDHLAVVADLAVVPDAAVGDDGGP